MKQTNDSEKSENDIPQRSVSLWIDQLKAGDRDATEKLWERYFRRLMGLARKRLENRPRLGSDAEDVALSAFDSFFRGAEAGKFPKLQDRDDLWHLLVKITARKSQRLIRDESCQKRGGNAVLGESAFFSSDGSSGPATGMDNIFSRAPSPAFAAQVTEEFERLFEQMGDANLRKIATLKMEGWTIADISEQLSLSPATIERKLKVIRTLWERNAA